MIGSHHTVFLTEQESRALEFAAQYVLELSDPSLYEAAGARGITHEMVQTAYATLRAQTAIIEPSQRRRR